MAVFMEHLERFLSEDIQVLQSCDHSICHRRCEASAVADAINTTPQTEIQYVNSLLSQVANTTIPAVGGRGLDVRGGRNSRWRVNAHWRPSSCRRR